LHATLADAAIHIAARIAQFFGAEIIDAAFAPRLPQGHEEVVSIPSVNAVVNLTDVSATSRNCRFAEHGTRSAGI